MKSIFKEGSYPEQVEHDIQVVEMDSRKPLTNGLFIPLLGERVDGHSYIEQAYKQGAVATLWNKEKDIPTHLIGKMHFFLVEDTLMALQQLAHAYRLLIQPTVIGITGSNGKTTTKDITQAIMETTYHTHATDGNYNNHVGLPLTILSMPTNTEVLILEMGMNDFGEIHALSKIAEPDYGCIVHIGESHIEHLHSREGIAQAKMEIIDGFYDDSVLLFDGDEPLLRVPFTHENISIGYDATNDEVVSDVHIDLTGTKFHVNEEGYSIPLLGKHHAKNATFAITLAKQLQVPEDAIHKGLSNIQVTSMRFEQIKTASGMTVINDAYNASPTSMKAAIDVVKQMTGYKQRILILGDILELGDFSESYHRSIGKAIEDPITAVYTFGHEAKYMDEELESQDHIEHAFVTNKEDICTLLKNTYGEETIILLKASRGMELETIVPTLITY